MWLILYGCEFLVLLLFKKKIEKSIFFRIRSPSPVFFSFLSLFLRFFFPFLICPFASPSSSPGSRSPPPPSHHLHLLQLSSSSPPFGSREAEASSSSSGAATEEDGNFGCVFPATFKANSGGQRKLEAWTSSIPK